MDYEGNASSEVLGGTCDHRAGTLPPCEDALRLEFAEGAHHGVSRRAEAAGKHRLAGERSPRAVLAGGDLSAQRVADFRIFSLQPSHGRVLYINVPFPAQHG